MTIRQPIITVAGHVDHGKTSLLDCFRGTTIQSGEAGGITQKISFTRFPLEQIQKMCPLLAKNQVDNAIPGFLFIDTPGHAAFTNLRKRGGALADLAILVVDIKEGIKPQTAEVISLLKANKTPFVIALNKIDTISGWQKRDSIQQAIELQTISVREQFDTQLLTFQGSLQSHGLESALYYEVTDFKKQLAIVPCSAKTNQGISELLFVLCGLCQKFLSKQLELGEDAKGIILEVKKEKTTEHIEAIMYDGKLEEGDEIAIAGFDKTTRTSIRAIEEIQPLSFKYKTVKRAIAATGLRIKVADKENVLPGMPFQLIRNNFEELEKQFKKELANTLVLDKQGIIVKADSLGSLEALLVLLKQAHVNVVKAGIGPISKTDIVAAKANLEINPLDACIVGFNVKPEEDLEKGKIQIFTNEVVYRLIEELELWRRETQAEIEKEKLMGLATICKLQILPQYVFRNSNPAIFGIRVIGGKVKTRIPLIDENGEDVAHVKALQMDKSSVEQAQPGTELAISLPGVTFDRQLKSTQFLYADMSELQFKAFKKHKDLLTSDELQVLQEIATIKRRKHETWGVA
jgi:translation initiation factor 5B